MPPTYTRKPNITDIAERSVKVRFPSWSAGSDNGSPATDYLIQHRVNGTDAWTSGDPLGLNRNALLYTVLLTNLEPETVYDVRIRPLLFHDGTLFYGTPGNYTTITTLSDGWYIRKRWRATACFEKWKFAFSSGWLKNGTLCHPGDIITLSKLIRMRYQLQLRHPDDILQCA